MYNPRTLLGVTKLDVVRANVFVAELLGIEPKAVAVPVVGGHAGITILPILSQARNFHLRTVFVIAEHGINMLRCQAEPRLDLTPAQAKALTERIQDAGTEVVKAKVKFSISPHNLLTFYQSHVANNAQAGKGSATLSMAYAAAEFAESCLRALAGQRGVVECAYVESHLTDLPFFASRLRLARSGVEVYILKSAASCQQVIDIIKYGKRNMGWPR